MPKKSKGVSLNKVLFVIFCCGIFITCIGISLLQNAPCSDWINGWWDAFFINPQTYFIHGIPESYWYGINLFFMGCMIWSFAVIAFCVFNIKKSERK